MSKIKNNKLEGVHLLLNGNYTIDSVTGELKINENITEAPANLNKTEPYVFTTHHNFELDAGLYNYLHIGTKPVLVDRAIKADSAHSASQATELRGTTAPDDEVYTYTDIFTKFNTLETAKEQLKGDVEDLQDRVTALENALKKTFGSDYLEGGVYYGSEPPSSAAPGQLYFYTSNNK